MKKGILIVSFGTTYRETREKNIERMVTAVREAFPDWQVCQAYSSNTVRNILKKRDNLIIPEPREALLQMKEDGITQAAILPTHIIDGIENNRMKQTIRECRDLFTKITTASVLLDREEDYKAVAKELWEEVKTTAKDTPVIFMGHGSLHEADKSYEKLEKELRSYSRKEIYIATVEGSITIEPVIERLKALKRKEKNVLLMPFMLVAGDHATNDMAGESDSFASRLRAEGYEARCILKGLGEYKSIRNIYIEHLKEVLE
ncbi:sirohydrochlorin cobaltochelatase [Anaerocolumna xylanovorans]|uniref:Sirohydrochlorin cobaltochelatase n=1 Tax=Anaerocolumna xylanovorans DSM 12503 TaxID=1121345 RepID=A0A1M7XYS5_9FIRM|nr:sirohydrochlorin cobaltochelatase [Anaerocolumna xylanovorans]SHO44233.1 sirohydrochlorin cobaltochelatase [Anaerocolumna xylanovorans DSM 12503]